MLKHISNIPAILAITVTLYTFYSCESSTEKYLRQWLHKTIVFPADLAFYQGNADSIQINHQDSTYKMLVLLDTVACISCQLRLDDWKRLMTDLDTMTHKRVQYLFMAQPYSKKLFQEELEEEDFTVPICLDDTKFRQMNHMPYNGTHVFLLNQANQVVCVGNPLLHKEIRNLYINILNLKNHEN